MKASLNRVRVTTDCELIEDAHIYKQPIVKLILAALLHPASLTSEQNKPLINNDDVLKLACRLSESVIVRIIEACETDFDTTRSGLLRLRRAGIGDRVIEMMLLKNFRATTSASSATTRASVS